MGKHRVRVRHKVKIGRNKKRKKILVKVTLVIILFCALSFAINKVSMFLLTSSIFDIKLVEIKGNNIIDKSVVLNCLDFNGKNIFLLKLKNKESQLKEEFAVIKNVKINRWFPNKIIVEIEERIPLAEILTPNKRVGIDENLKLFVLSENYTVLTKISDDLTLENKIVCLRFLKEILNLPVYKKIKEITAISPNDVVFFIENNCKVCIGNEQNVEQKISYLEKVLSDLETKGKQAQYINMRDFSDENKEVVIRMN
ncbi:MAG: FtsQ-type POTRA domain-containing protein [Elusimicrobiota bacterium]